jgi:hypothetical protein
MQASTKDWRVYAIFFIANSVVLLRLHTKPAGYESVKIWRVCH